MTTQVIKPGILVALRTSVYGGVSYQREDIRDDQGTETASAAEATPAAERRKVEKWKTTKIVTDAVEHEDASKTRSAALALIRRQCVETSFGLLATAAKEAELDAAIKEARDAVRAFNDRSRYSKISVNVLKGRVASTDEEAVRAVSAELASLMRDMEDGIKRMDPAEIRTAAQKAAKMQAVLGEDQQMRVSAAVEAARKAAREIVRRVEKGGEDAAVVMADLQTTAIETARVQFLELETGTLPVEAMPEADLGRMAALEGVEAPEPPAANDAPEGPQDAPGEGDGEPVPPRAPWWPSAALAPVPGPAPEVLTAGELLQQVAPPPPPAPPTEPAPASQPPEQVSPGLPTPPAPLAPPAPPAPPAFRYASEITVPDLEF